MKRNIKSQKSISTYKPSKKTENTKNYNEESSENSYDDEIDRQSYSSDHLSYNEDETISKYTEKSRRSKRPLRNKTRDKSPQNNNFINPSNLDMNGFPMNPLFSSPLTDVLNPGGFPINPMMMPGGIQPNIL